MNKPKKHRVTPDINFDSVTFFREVKEKMAKELEGKSFEDQKKILNKYALGELVIEPSSVSIAAEPMPKYGKKK